MMKTTIPIFLILGILSRPVCAASTIDDESRTVANKVMQNVFDRIIFEKSKHAELSDFDKKNLSLNSRQMSVIEYSSQMTQEHRPYGFALTILPLNEPLPQEWKDNGFELVFPVLKLKFAGYQRRAVDGRFDIRAPMQRYGQILSEYQQQFLPLQMSISAEKEIYKTDEEIIFTITLTNTSSASLLVKPLNSTNLYILYDNTMFPFSTEDPLVRQTSALEPGHSLSKTFHGDAFQFPRDIEIYVSYNMTFDGVKPFSRVRLKIIKP